jgi:hypothetical protein
MLYEQTMTPTEFKNTDRLKDGQLRFVKITMSDGTDQWLDRLVKTKCPHCNQTLSQ